jgi:riboflavin synthase
MLFIRVAKIVFLSKMQGFFLFFYDIWGMFTGIIENLGEVIEVEQNGSNKSYWIYSEISNELKIDQSVSHSGVCLTVDALAPQIHRVTAIDETLRVTNLNSWKTGTVVNLERCLRPDSLLDGHIVQGHVDGIGKCESILPKNGSTEYTISFPDQFAHLIIEKGSISVNGISLTCFNVTRNTFTIAIIPYTFQYTNMHQLLKGHLVNLEFDIVGKYLQRMNSLK